MQKRTNSHSHMLCKLPVTKLGAWINEIIQAKLYNWASHHLLENYNTHTCTQYKQQQENNREQNMKRSL
jgi:hypothetical protein